MQYKFAVVAKNFTIEEPRTLIDKLVNLHCRGYETMRIKVLNDKVELVYAETLSKLAAISKWREVADLIDQEFEVIELECK